MLFYILLIVISIFSCLCYKYSAYDKMAKFIFSYIIGCILGTFVIFVCSMEATWKEIKREQMFCPIFSLKTEKEISGSFFLGSGGIGTDEKYYYFCKDDRGGFYRGSQYAYDCIIFQSNSVPQIQWQNVTYKCPSWIIPWTLTTQRKTKYDFIVPAGTVIEKFEIK